MVNVEKPIADVIAAILDGNDAVRAALALHGYGKQNEDEAASQPAPGELMDNPWEQVGFLKEKLRQAEQEREVWRERAMNLRTAGPQPLTVQDAARALLDACKLAKNKRWADCTDFERDLRMLPPSALRAIAEPGK